MFGVQLDHFTTFKKSLWDITRWHKVLFDSRVGVSQALSDKAAKVTQIVDNHYQEAEPKDVRLHRQNASDLPVEIFARLYAEDLKEREQPSAQPWLRKIHNAVSAANLQVLHDSVCRDPDFAALATSKLLDVVLEALPRLLEESEEEKKQEQQGGDGQDQQQGPSPAEQGLADALSSMAREAAKDVEDTKELLGTLSPGSQFEPTSSSQERTDRMEMIERLKKDKYLREVLRKAGRIRRTSRRNRMVKSEVARDTVKGLEQGGDVSRILPVELAQLRHPLTRKLALRKILERKATQYAYNGKEPLGRGPVLVLVDESGSMAGTPHEWARSIAIACVSMAVREHRPIKVAGFNSGVRHVHSIDKRGRTGHICHVNRYGKVLSEQKHSLQDTVASLASITPDGGTSFSAAIRWALDNGLNDRKADLILITDGECRVGSDTLDRVAIAKRDGLKIFGVLINGGGIGTLDELCDEVIDLNSSGDFARDAARITL